MNEESPEDGVRVEVDGRVVIVTLDRGPVNAVDQLMYRALRDVFAGVGTSGAEGRVCILRGAGPHFCAGNDIHEFVGMTPLNASVRMRAVREAFAAILECPLPVIAAVHGSALGTGLAIAACCDIVVASEDAVFGTPEVGVGVLGGARHLARLVPEQVMRRMYFTGEPASAEELSRYGGVSAVVPRERLDDEARRLAESIARHSPHVLRAAKEALNRTEHMPLKQAYEEEQQLTVRVASHADSIRSRQAVADGQTLVFE